MRIGIISDTHSYLHPAIFEHFDDCDEIWHAGDIGSYEVLEQLSKKKKVRAVFGNIDGTDVRCKLKEYLFFHCENTGVLIIHIGGYPGKYTLQAQQLIKEFKPQLFISGHSHILKIIYDNTNELLHINPGAAGRYGLHHVKTIVKLDIIDKKFSNLQVIEMGKK